MDHWSKEKYRLGTRGFVVFAFTWEGKGCTRGQEGRVEIEVSFSLIPPLSALEHKDPQL